MGDWCRRGPWECEADTGWVQLESPACPAFVPTKEPETPHPYTVQCKCGSVFRTSKKGCTECADCIEEIYGE